MISSGLRTWIIVAAALSLSVMAQPRPAQAQTSLEYGVKANYLVRFAAFVEWPPPAFAGPRAPVLLCVIGRDPFGGALVQAAASQTVFGRPLAVSTRSTAQGVAGCNIVYVGSGADPALVAAGDQPTLWVTDAAVSTRRGMIHFVIAGNRVRFHIDQRAAAGRRLSISSRLLDLALTVQSAGR